MPKMPEPISKAKLLLVEGNDEEALFGELLRELQLAEIIQIVPVKGKDRFPDELKGVIGSSNFHQIVTSIGVVRDADDNPKGAFESVCGAIGRAQLIPPSAPLKPSTGSPQVTVMIVPDATTKGMLENICLDSVKDD